MFSSFSTNHQEPHNAERVRPVVPNGPPDEKQGTGPYPVQDLIDEEEWALIKNIKDRASYSEFERFADSPHHRFRVQKHSEMDQKTEAFRKGATKCLAQFIARA